MIEVLHCQEKGLFISGTLLTKDVKPSRVLKTGAGDESILGATGHQFSIILGLRCQRQNTRRNISVGWDLPRHKPLSVRYLPTTVGMSTFSRVSIRSWSHTLCPCPHPNLRRGMMFYCCFALNCCCSRLKWFTFKLPMAAADLCSDTVYHASLTSMQSGFYVSWF